MKFIATAYSAAYLIWSGIALAIMLVSTSACGGYLGPAALVPANGSRVTYGGSAGYRTYFGSGEGFVFGANATLAPPAEGKRKSRILGDLTAGYGYLPLPYRGQWGIELGAGPAAGVIPNRDGYPYSMGVGWQLDVPYRVSGTRKPWEVKDRYENYSSLMASFAGSHLIPIGSGHDHVFTTTFVFSLSYRFDTWLAVEP
jgi:hypothetical protein